MTQKDILYRGGIAAFTIPQCWVEEYEPSGGATFYEDIEDSGTLRLNVLSFESRNGESADNAVASLVEERGYERLFETLAIRYCVKESVENDEQLQIHSWEVCVPVEPVTVRLIVFSFTILASQSTNPSFRQQVESLDNSIRTGRYSRSPGFAE